MIWNTIPNQERLLLWKKLRSDMSYLSLELQIIELAKFCSTMPFGSRTMNYYDPEDWPTPWEILFYGSFCTSSISLLMYYTLILTPVNATVELYLVEDDTGVYLLPIINNRFVLNYELGKVNILTDIKDQIKTLKVYTNSDIKEIK